jgi:hypothetical protein
MIIELFKQYNNKGISMETKSNKKMISGYIMAGVGFAFILYSAINYIFGLNLGTPSAAIGIVFLGVGMAMARKAKRES